MSTKWKKVVTMLSISAMLATNQMGIYAAEASNENVEENVSDENAEENVSDENAEENVSDENAKENVSDENAEENVSDENAEENVSDENTEGNVSDENTEGNVSDENAEENVSDENAEENVSDENTEGNSTEEDEEEKGSDVNVEVNVAEIGAEEKNMNSISLFALEEYNTPSVSWDSNNPGLVNVEFNNIGEFHFNFTLYKDGEEVMTGGWDDNYTEENNNITLYMNTVIDTTGTYVMKLKVVSVDSVSDKDYSSGAAAETAEYNYTAPTKKLQTPSNIKWSTSKKGLVTWDKVEHARDYYVDLFKSDGTYVTSEWIENGEECDLSKHIQDGEKYKVQVIARTDNIEEYLDSEYSDFVEMSETNGNDEGMEGVEAVTNLRWNTEVPGEAVFYNPNEENVSFQLHYFKDGHRIGTWSTSARQPGDVKLPIYDHIFDSATYTFQVETFGYGVEQDYDLSSGCVSEVSEDFVYTRPSAQIAVPGNISWDSTGIVSWDVVEHAKTYWSYLYRADDSFESGYYPLGGNGNDTTSRDYADQLASGYDYYIRIRAVSENINLYANSEYSDYIAFNNTSVDDTVNGKLDEEIDNVTADNVEQVVDSVKDAFANSTSKGELQIAMQTNSETQEKMQNLEEIYKQKVGITTAVKPSEDIGIDTSSVKLLGAALNATERGSVTFNMSKPSEEIQKDLITNSRFKKAIVLDLELEGAGIEKGKTLDIPVTVTMAAPADIDISLLTILHYNDNGTYEVVPVRKNADGTISFTVTHFSNFVFGEKETASKPTQPGDSHTESNSSSSSSGGSSFSTAVEVVKKVPSVGNSQGWKNISKEVDAALAKVANSTAANAVVTVKLNGIEEIPENVLAAIAGKDVTLMFITNEDIIINVNGAALDVNALGKIKLISSKDKDGNVTLKIRNTVVDVTKAIAVFAKAEKTATEGTLYFMNADGTLISFRNSIVYENGYVAFEVPFVNANYVIK